LALNEKAEGMALHHFSVLAVIAPAFSCGSETGWHATRNSQRCTKTGANTTYLDFACEANPYCFSIDAHCCAAPGSTECHYDDQLLTLEFSFQGNSTGAFPWCGPAPTKDAGTKDAGMYAGKDAATDEDSGTQGGGAGTQGGSG